jgi:hypothetical protein
MLFSINFPNNDSSRSHLTSRAQIALPAYFFHAPTAASVLADSRSPVAP